MKESNPASAFALLAEGAGGRGTESQYPSKNTFEYRHEMEDVSKSEAYMTANSKQMANLLASFRLTDMETSLSLSGIPLPTVAPRYY